MSEFDWHSRIYSGTQAARLAGFERVSFNQLFTRGHFRLIGEPNDRRAEKRGAAHSYSLRSIMGYAAARHLIGIGIHPRNAFDAMIPFAYVGDEARIPGDIYNVRERGFTFLRYLPTLNTSHVFAAETSLSFGDLFGPGEFDGVSGPPPVIVICLNTVVDGVMRRLVETGPDDDA